MFIQKNDLLSNVICRFPIFSDNFMSLRLFLVLTVFLFLFVTGGFSFSVKLKYQVKKL